MQRSVEDALQRVLTLNAKPEFAVLTKRIAASITCGIALDSEHKREEFDALATSQADFDMWLRFIRGKIKPKQG